MVYQKKDNKNIKAQLDFHNDKFMTSNMIYLTGPDKGKAFVITDATLHTQWEEGQLGVLDDLDYDKINEPYPEPEVQRYIPIPKSVLEYEMKRRNKNTCTFNKPANYEEFADLLAQNDVELKKVNTGYITLPDNSKLKLMSVGIGFLASNYWAEKLVGKGFECKPCIEPGTPFRFDIKTQEQFDILIEVLKDV